MQLIHLPKAQMIALFFILWPILQVGASLLSLRISDEALSAERWLFRTRRWERSGKIYDTFLGVRLWKKYLPDGAALFRNGYRKRRLGSFSRENLERFITESCRAELAHWLAILPFWVFGLFAPLEVLPSMFIYAVAVNAPCIIAQRYNRPRVLRLMEALEDRET